MNLFNRIITWWLGGKQPSTKEQRRQHSITMYILLLDGIEAKQVKEVMLCKTTVKAIYYRAAKAHAELIATHPNLDVAIPRRWNIRELRKHSDTLKPLLTSMAVS